MMVREPVVAGRFYPEQADQCSAELGKLLDAFDASPRPGTRVYGGLVPHAGWNYSGPVTARVFKALASRQPDVVVLFGGVHRYRGREAPLYARGKWETPLGPIEVDCRLAERILGQTNLIVEDPYAHEEEHSLEVQVPFVQRLFPNVKIVALMVPSVATAHEVGQAVARTLGAYGYDALIVGTTDLTHYGPHYGFMPMGVGQAGHAWAKDNDKRFIELVRRMRETELVKEASEHKNACSAGAAAATVAAVGMLGASEGVLLDHLSSNEVAQRTAFDSTDSVGYAGFVFM